MEKEIEREKSYSLKFISSLRRFQVLKVIHFRICVTVITFRFMFSEKEYKTRQEKLDYILNDTPTNFFL